MYCLFFIQKFLWIRSNETKFKKTISSISQEEYEQGMKRAGRNKIVITEDGNLVL